MIIYLCIFAGSYLLFFVSTLLYLHIARDGAVAVLRQKGLTDEMIDDRLDEREPNEWKFARRSTMINGTIFAMLLASTYSFAMYVDLGPLQEQVFAVFSKSRD